MRKTYIIAGIIVLVAIIIAAIAFLVHYQGTKNIIHSKDPGLTSQEHQTVENQLKDAENQLKNLPASATNQDRYRLYLQEGALYFELGQFDDAKDAYQKALGYVKDNANGYHEMFVVDNAMRDFKAARTDIEQAIKLNATSPQFWKDRINLMKDAFKASDDELQNLFNEALEKTNHAVDIVTAYAQFLEAKGDLAGAVAQWRAAMLSNPGAKDLYQQEINRLKAKLQ